jgi:DHA1 family bicyclomycin/chloramphenicol resistance-like MFS transporter
MVVASVGCILAETLPQLIAARFLQALGGAAGMVVSRASSSAISIPASASAP